MHYKKFQFPFKFDKKMSCRVLAPSKDELRAIVKEKWCPPRNSYDEVYPGIFIGDGYGNWTFKTVTVS